MNLGGETSASDLAWGTGDEMNGLAVDVRWERNDAIDTHFFKMPIKMRNLELSLWFSSVGGAIVGGAPDADMLRSRGVGGTAEQRGTGPFCEDDLSLL
jgi:hypothetical protein